MKRFLVIAITLGLLAAAAFGADVTGQWKATVPTADGQTAQSLLDLKADGETLTGTVSGALGEGKIEDGVVKGDEVSFSVTGDQGKVIYKGTIVNDTMKLTVQSGDKSFEVTAKREA